MAPKPENRGWVRCKLKKIMTEREISIRSVALGLGVSESSVALYYHNRFTRIECRIAYLLCAYFKVGLGEMFELGENKDDADTSE